MLPTSVKAISVDDHIIEPPHLWQTRLPQKYRDIGPRVIELDDGTQAWTFEEQVVRTVRGNTRTRPEFDQSPHGFARFEQMRPGCYDPAARLEDMDQGWVEASMCFPTFPRFCGQTFAERSDKELGLACVKAYNDWMVEEWCGDSNGRLVPLCLIPLWDVPAAVEEVRRNAARGVPAVCFSELPYHLGLPTIHSGHWDPFFEACADTGTTVAMHIGSSSKMPVTTLDAPGSVSATLAFGNAMYSMVDFLMSGVLPRYPALNLLYAESQIGWIPYVLQRIDQVWEDNQAWAQTKHIPEPPSTYYYQSIYGCFINDPHGLSSLDEIGLGNVTAETDYPHSDSSWPNTKEVMTKLTAGLSDTEIHQVLRGNAIKLLRLPFA